MEQFVVLNFASSFKFLSINTSHEKRKLMSYNFVTLSVTELHYVLIFLLKWA